MKKSKTLMMMAMLGFLVSGISITAAESSETTNTNTETYIAVPMHMFDRMTGNKPEKKAPETFLYQDGKLVKCEADLQALQKDCKKGKNRENYRGKSKRDQNCERGNKRGGRNQFAHDRRPKHDDKLVLLTQAQMKDLMKQKLEHKLKDIDNSDSKPAKAFDKAIQNAPVVKVNGKDAKVINPMNLFKGPKHGHGRDVPPPPAELND